MAEPRRGRAPKSRASTEASGDLDAGTVQLSAGGRGPDSEGIRLGRFRVVPGARQLRANGRAVNIGSRAFDLLMALLVARGNVVDKDSLMAQVWPSTVVDACNLRFQMAALRRAL